VFIFYLARQYYELRLFNEASEYITQLEKFPEFNNNLVYSSYFHGLNILINIATLKFDKAVSLIENYLKTRKDYMNSYLIYILKFYLLIHKLVSFNTGDENTIIDMMVNCINNIFEDIEKEYRK
jgi:hypothetical protein